MRIQKHITQWQEEKIISAAQAKKMQESLKKQGASSAMQILSIIGAICMAIGVISVVSSNWQVMPDWLRITVLVVANVTTLYAGYVLQFKKQNYPRTGKSLLFLSSAFFGATIFLIAQIFNISTEYNHVLFGLWLLGIAPVIYGFRSTASAYLFSGVFMTWLLMTIDHYIDFEGIKRFLFFAISFAIVGLGALQKQVKGFEAIGQAYRNISLVVVAGFAFILSIEGAFEGIMYKITPDIAATALFAGEAAIPLLIAHRNNHDIVDFKLAIFAITLFGLLHLQNPVVYNVIYLITLLSFLYSAAKQNSILGIHALSIMLFVYLFSKYIEIFHDAFDGGIFFISCGAILIGGSVYLEKRLRKIRRTSK